MPSGTPFRPSRNRNARPPRNRASSGPQPWMWDAACATAGPEGFFPRDRHDPQIPEAKRVCARCPVRTQCLDYALTTQEESGIWGGLDEWERRDLLDRRRRENGSPGAA